MKIKLLIGLMIVLISAPIFANETATSMGDRSWQFGTPFENQVRLNMAVARELQDRYRNPRQRKRGLGVGNGGLGVGGGVFIGNVDTINFTSSHVENNINSKNSNQSSGNSTINTNQNANDNGQTGTATTAGNTTGDNSPITNN